MLTNPVTSLNNSIFILLIIIFTSVVGYGETCDEWFKNLKIDPTDKKCVSVCTTRETDMGTFSCPSECEKFCSTNKKKDTKCKFNSSLIKLDSIPKKWPWEKDKTIALSQNDSDFLNDVLRKVNPLLWKDIEGIYLLERPKDLFSIGTESSYYDSQIILYRKAFAEKDTLLKKIIHELGHHLHETSEKNNFSKYTKSLFQKDRKYLSTDSKFSPEEDFATNFEIYIEDPSYLKKELPSVYNWFNKNIGKKYNLRECD